MEGTTARLRKTFQFPDDNDSDDDLPEALDEEGQLSPRIELPSKVSLLFSFFFFFLLSVTRKQHSNLLTEQEYLIQTLNQQNANLNLLYSRILLAIPLISMIPYLATLFNPLTSILSILSISSLLSTAYLVFTLMPDRTNIPFLDNLNKPNPSNPRDVVYGSCPDPRPHGPIAEYLPLLNIALCTVLGLLGMVFKGREDVWWGFGWLPAGVYGVVLLAKVIMGSVDPEAELGGLRYGFKGA